MLDIRNENSNILTVNAITRQLTACKVNYTMLTYYTPFSKSVTNLKKSFVPHS